MEEKMSLHDLQEQIKNGVEGAVPHPVWVSAEIAELNNHASGHCYMDLVDYSEGGKSVAAKARGVIWSNTYRMLKPYFETATGISLARGLNVLVKVAVNFSNVYGLSLNILDIDPSYTVGELELKRRKTIERLQNEGCIGMNAALELPVLPKRIAVVSSANAAGYRDFMKHLHSNEGGYRFYTELFAAQMQGEEAPASIIAALDSIALRENEFDAVAIVRGGGAVMDLVCFDDYELAANVAQFPIPVITGIGHDHDFHVADMVAHTWLKTPTAVADFFVGIFTCQEQYIMQLYQRISLTLAQKISTERHRLLNMLNSLKHITANLVSSRRQQLELLCTRMDAANPQKVLNRGFAVATLNGAAARVGDVQEGKIMRLWLSDGMVEFEIGGIKEKIIGKI